MSIKKSDLIEDLKKSGKKYARQFSSKSQNITRDYYRTVTGCGRSYLKFWKNFTDFKKSTFEYKEPFNRQSLENKVKSRPENTKVLFVTAAVEGQMLSEGFFNAITKSFIPNNNAELIVLGCIAPSGSEEYDPGLEKYTKLFASEYQIASNIIAVDMMINPQQILPLTGLTRYGSQDHSLILASPKQHMVIVPSKQKTPNFVHSTGVCTLPTNYRQTRRGRIALKDHMLGGLIIEIVDDRVFHLRQVQCFNRDGSFYDLNKKYCPDGSVENAEIELLYLGDVHTGWMDENSVNAVREQISLLKPGKVFMGDVFDATSISHHTEQDIVRQVNRPEHLKLLKDELDDTADFLKKINSLFPKISIGIIRGNHDEHLDLYLTEQRWVKDRFNYRIAIKCMGWLLDEKNPIKEYVREKYPELKNIKWLDRNSNFYISKRNIEVSLHGDIGFDGRRGSARTLEISTSRCTIGHVHTPYIFREIWAAGTNSVFDLPYRKGTSTGWVAANISHYKNGQRQLLINIPDRGKSRWCLNNEIPN